MKLYSYYRSSSAYRVRIALNLKKLDYETIPVHLLNDGGEQHKDDYKKLNPQEMVPTLVCDDVSLTQSMAIIEYLDDIYPEIPLVSGSAKEKAYIRQLALTIACDIQPLNNLKVMQYLGKNIGASDQQKAEWSAHWGKAGIEAFEKLLQQQNKSGEFSIGNTPSLADICLIPQLYNLRRIKLPLDDYPLCVKIDKNCMKLQAFKDASPEAQDDAPAIMTA